MNSAPVIAIDGPSASGKGTVAQEVAAALGFHYLNSGALYRLVAHSALRRGVSLDDEAQLGVLAAGLDVDFRGEEILIQNEQVTDEIRSEDVAAGASRVASLPGVRTALLERQRRFARPPGLVAEGRDMGSVVFPGAVLKIFLTASAEERALRRYKQLKQKGIAATLPSLLEDLRQRDARDAARSVAPLKQCPDARQLDTTAMSAKQAAERILAWYRGLDW
ncbi:MAG: (d)CMP kinase [Betaproteobacteria bacterium]|nr:(d)CMP kinase [Betaproteobacteria bacterium]